MIIKFVMENTLQLKLGWFMMFNATFNNISVIYRGLVLSWLSYIVAQLYRGLVLSEGSEKY